jgi:thiamine monophosphate synthase
MTERKRKSGGQSTAAARQAIWKSRMQESGMKKVAVIVPVSREDDIREIAREMREIAQNTEIEP